MDTPRTTPGVRARHIVALALAMLAVGALVGPAHARRYQPPSPGAAGVGDRLFPQLGNGGYDAKQYHLALTYPTSAPEQDVDGRVAMIARATRSLSSVALPASADPDVLFSANVYDGGATVLYALRQLIGDETFRKLDAGRAPHTGSSASCGAAELKPSLCGVSSVRLGRGRRDPP